MSRADGVLRRWNPVGWMHLHDPPGAQVRVVGLPGSGVGTLIEELRHLGDTRPGAFDIVRDPPAAVTLVVLDATAVMGDTELALFRDAATGSSEVVCALTGIDRCPRWREVRDADLELLHRHAPWVPDVPVLPVSALVAEESRRHDNSPAGDGGGLRALHDVLAAAVRSAGELRRTRGAVVDRTRLMIDEEIARLGSQDDTANLRAQRSRLVTAPVPPAPRPDLHGVRTRLLRTVAGTLREASDAAFAELEADGDADVVAAILDDHIDELCRVLTEGRVLSVDDGSPGVRVPVPEITRSAPPTPGGRSLEDTLTVVFGASAGAGLGRLLAASFDGLPVWTSMPIAVMCAVPAAWWLLCLRRRIGHRDRMRRWVADELAAVRSELDAWIRNCLHEEEVQAMSTAAAGRDEHVARVRERIAVLDAGIARMEGERRARIAACERDLAALRPGVEPDGRRARRTG